MYLDHTVYPDLDDLPDDLPDGEAKADYVERICAAWDFDLFPEPQTFQLFGGWKEIFDLYPLPHSPAYHTFRRLFGWEDVPFPEHGALVHLTWEVLDRLEGRGPDPCESMV